MSAICKELTLNKIFP